VIVKVRDYIIRRIILSIPVILGALFITFFLSHVIGNPAAAYVTERTPPEAIPAIIHQHGLDRPIWEQFFFYLRDVITGDWGYSMAVHMDVTAAIATFFPATFELAMAAMVFSVGLGIPLGIVSATHKDQWIDQLTRIIALSGVSLPVFWLALMLKYIFYYKFWQWGLPYLPNVGRVDHLVEILYPIKRITGLYLFDSLIQGNFVFFWSALIHLIMPAFCLGYISMALITRMMRSSMLEVLKEDYILLARAKGLSERVVIYRHALRNALIPTVTVIGLAFGGLMTGAVLTETIFAWHGLGQWSTAAILTTDFAAINGFTLLVAFIFVIMNLLVDLLYGILDPRIRYS